MRSAKNAEDSFERNVFSHTLWLSYTILLEELYILFANIYCDLIITDGLIVTNKC